MADAVNFVGYVNVALFCGLAVVVAVQWRRHPSEPGKWAALTFFALSVAVVAAVALPSRDREEFDITRRVLTSLLALIPYSFYAFTRAFEPRSAVIDRLALPLTIAVAVWPFALAELPPVEGPRPAPFQIFVAGLLVQWTVLSAAAAIRLWSAGRDQPSIVRKRMRTLAIASFCLSFAIVVAGAETVPDSALDVAVGILAAGTATLFYAGLAPPRMLRSLWRRPEERSVQLAATELLGTSSVVEVAASLLPYVEEIVGARAAAMLDEDGAIVASHGADSDAVARARDADDNSVVRLSLTSGSLVVWLGPYTPFFGRDDLELLRTLGLLGQIALQRAHLSERESAFRRALEEANEALAEAQAVAHIGSWEWDLANSRLRCSDELYRMFAIKPTAEGPTYDHLLDRIPAADRDRVAEEIAAALSESDSFEVEHSIERPDGSRRLIRSRGRIAADDGRPNRIIGTAQDVTDHKRVEEERRKLAEAIHHQKQALELNDNVVQGLALAKYSLEAGLGIEALETIDKTLAAARSIVTGLLSERDIRPGDLVREQPASLVDEEPTR